MLAALLEAPDHRQARFGDRRIDSHSGMGSCEAVVDLAAKHVSEVRLGIGEQRPGLRIIRIDFDGPRADTHYPLFAAHVAVVAARPILPGQQVELVSGDVGGSTPFERLALRWHELDLERLDDRRRDFVLNSENVFEVAVEALRPDMLAADSVDELRVDPHTPARLPHAAFKNVGDPELLSEIADVHRLTLEGECGVAGDNAQRRDFRQIGRDVFADAVAEIFLLGIAAHVLKRQYADSDARSSPMSLTLLRYPRCAGERVDAFDKLSPARLVSAAGPTVEVGALDLVEGKRRNAPVDGRLHQGAGRPRRVGLGADPLRLRRFRRPQDDYCSGGLQMLFDDIGIGAMRGKLVVAPHVVSGGAKRSGHAIRMDLISPRIGNEDVRHTLAPAPSIPRLGL